MVIILFLGYCAKRKRVRKSNLDRLNRKTLLPMLTVAKGYAWKN